MNAILEAVKRETHGKNAARRTRQAGQVPAIFYGHRRAESGAPEATSIAVDPKALMGILHSESGANTLITFRVEGEPETRVMIKEFQLDPVTHAPLHADFYQIALDRKITVTVPVLITGEAPGVKTQGGLLDFVHREVDIECLPTEIPEHIEVDVSELALGQGVRLREVADVARWTAKTDLDVMLVHVVAPKAVVEEAPAAPAEATAAEPEVIKKGKTEKEGEKEG